MRFLSYGVILFLSVWAFIAVVPSLRHQTLVGADPLTGLVIPPKLPNLQSALKSHPDDPFLLSQRLQEENGADNPVDRKIRGEKFFTVYDALIAKNTSDLKLRRTRLRLATGMRLTGEPHSLKYWQAEAKRQHYTVPPLEKIGMTPAGLEATAALAHSSAALAPHDAFFPYIEAMALDGLGREDASLQALQRAAKCHDFNDGAMDETRQRLAYFAKTTPFDWDEKLLVVAGQLWPHFGQMRVLARETVYIGVDDYKAGKKDKAWRRWEAGLRAAAVVRQSQSHGPHGGLIGLLVSEAIESVILRTIAQEVCGYFPGRVVTNDSKSRFLQFENRQRKDAHLFEQLARRDGHAELAAFIHRLADSIIARRHTTMLTTGESGVPDDALGWQTPQAKAETQLAHFGWWISLLAWICALGLPLAYRASRAGRETSAPKGLVWSLSIFLASFWIGVMIWAIWAGPESTTFRLLDSVIGGYDSTDTVTQPPAIDWTNACCFFWGVTTATFLVLYNVVRLLAAKRALRKSEAEKSQGKFSMVGTAPMMAWVVTGVFSAALWVDGLSFDRASSIILILLPCWLIAQALALFLTWKERRTKNREEAVSMPYAWCTALGLASSILLTRPMPTDDMAYLACGFIFAAVAVVTVQVVRSWRGVGSFSGYMRMSLNAYGRVMANLGLALSLAYLGLSLAFWPTRVELNERVDKYVRIGEIEWMREHRLYGLQDLK